jgi:hypothetical protein
MLKTEKKRLDYLIQDPFDKDKDNQSPIKIIFDDTDNKHEYYYFDIDGNKKVFPMSVTKLIKLSNPDQFNSLKESTRIADNICINGQCTTKYKHFVKDYFQSYRGKITTAQELNNRISQLSSIIRFVLFQN